MNNKTLLHILLVLTFLFAGVSALSYLLSALMMPAMQQIYADNPGLLPEQFSVMMQQLMDTPRGYFLGAGLLYLLEVVGGVLMWRLRWTGFHCYTLARLLLLLLPALFLGRSFVGVGDIMMALLLVAVYYMLMRRLTAERQDSDPPQENLPDNPEE